MPGAVVAYGRVTVALPQSVLLLVKARSRRDPKLRARHPVAGELVALAEAVGRATHAAVSGLRAAGYSWAEIASRLGISRQAAQQRWGAT